MNTAELLHYLSKNDVAVWRDNAKIIASSKAPLKHEIRLALDSNSDFLCTLLSVPLDVISANSLFEKYQEKFAISWGNGTYLTRAGDYAILDVSKAHATWKLRDLRKALLRGFVVKSWSERFHEAIYYVRTTNHICILRPLLPCETPIYTLDELSIIGKNLSLSKDFNIIHRIKKIFGATITHVTENPNEAGSKK